MLVVEVAIVHEGSGGTRGESRQQVPRVYGSGVARGVGLGSYCDYLLCLVRSIEPTKLLFTQTIVDRLVRFAHLQSGTRRVPRQRFTRQGALAFVKHCI